MIYLGDRATVNNRISNIMPVTPKRDKTHCDINQDDHRARGVRRSHRATRDSCSAYTVFMRLSRIRLAAEARRDGLASAIGRRIISRFFSRVCNPQIADTTSRKRTVIGPQPELPTAIAIASRLTVHLGWPYHPAEKRDYAVGLHRRPRPGGSAFRSICHANAYATHDKAARNSCDSSLRNGIDSGTYTESTWLVLSY